MSQLQTVVHPTTIATLREDEISAGRIWLALGGLFALNLILRVFYLRYQFVSGDEAVRALTALEMLRGARLYVDVVTDKPPGTTLFYAAVMSLFPHSMAAVHVAAAVWNFGTAMVILRLAARFYSIRTGLWAALLFVYFSTNYFTQDAMAANTELLMALPYTAAFYFYLKAAFPDRRTPHFIQVRHRSGRGEWWLFAAGFMTAVSVVFKQVGGFGIVFFCAFEFLRTRMTRASEGTAARPVEKIAVTDDRLLSQSKGASSRVGLIGIGFIAAVGLLVWWLRFEGALGGFWRNAIALGAVYVGSLPLKLWLKFMVLRTAGYILFNSALWSLAILAVWRMKRALTDRREQISLGPRGAEQDEIQAIKTHELTDDHFRLTREYGSGEIDAAVALWGLISLLGAFTSGRFYGHYFIQALPALSLLGARGVHALQEMLADPARNRGAKLAAIAISLAFVFGLVRFHEKTAVLAFETISGRRTHWSTEWGMARREQQSQVIADRIRSEVGTGNALYIWGYALDVYWRSGCVPASRYISPYYVTGHFYPEVVSASEAPGQEFWKAARLRLIDDLTKTRPRIILNVDEPIQTLQYPEVVEFINSHYRYDGVIGTDPDYQCIVYRLRDDPEPVAREDQVPRKGPSP